MNSIQRNEILSRYQEHSDRFEAIAASRPRAGRAPIGPRADDRPGTLTGRELQVLQLISTGLANRDIATRLVVSVETVKTHVRNILAKMHSASRAHAVAVGFRHGLLT